MFKIVCITYKTICTNQPAYLHSVLNVMSLIITCISLTPSCSLSFVFEHISVSAALLQSLPPSGSFQISTIPLPHVVFVATSKHFSTTQLLGHSSSYVSNSVGFPADIVCYTTYLPSSVTLTYCHQSIIHKTCINAIISKCPPHKNFSENWLKSVLMLTVRSR